METFEKLLVFAPYVCPGECSKRESVLGSFVNVLAKMMISLGDPEVTLSEQEFGSPI